VDAVPLDHVPFAAAANAASLEAAINYGCRMYAATAEFYDLLQAKEYLGIAERLAARWLGRPSVGVLDVGAGTGLATALFTRATDVIVHAVEPAAAMRTVLLSRLAGRPELLARVRLHAKPIADLGLIDVADVAWCLNTMATLDEHDRKAALDAIGAALVPGGTLIVQRPPEQPGPDRRDLPSWQLGGDLYGGEVTCTPDGPDRVLWRYAYRVTRDDQLVREEHEEFRGHLVSAAGFRGELEAAGFTPTGADDPDVVIARKIRPA
jgi:SAM-dependent methyltransferase